MNTTRTHSLQALTAAVFMTLAMLLSVNTLAQNDSAAQQQLAQRAQSTQA